MKDLIKSLKDNIFMVLLVMNFICYYLYMVYRYYGGYLNMDSTIISIAGSIIVGLITFFGVVWKSAKDNRLEFKNQSHDITKEHNSLSNEHSKLSNEHTELSKEQNKLSNELSLLICDKNDKLISSFNYINNDIGYLKKSQEDINNHVSIDVNKAINNIQNEIISNNKIIKNMSNELEIEKSKNGNLINELQKRELVINNITQELSNSNLDLIIYENGSIKINQSKSKSRDIDYGPEL